MSCGTKVLVQEALDEVAATSSAFENAPAPAPTPTPTPTPNPGETFDLFGVPVTLPPVTKVYVTIRDQFEAKAREAKKHLQTKIENNYRSLEDLMSDGDKVADSYTISALELGLNILHSNGIYNLDFEAFARRAMKYIGYWDHHFSGVREKFQEIASYKEEQKQLREIKKDSRGRVVGGGFGVGGAVKGMAMAGTANLATGMLHSFSNAIGNAFTAAESSSLKNKVFNDKETRNAIVSALYLDVFAVHKATIECLNNKALQQVSDFYADHEDEANVIYENILEGKVPERDLNKQIAEILIKDPFDITYYELALKENWGTDYEQVMKIAGVVKYANYFVVPIDGLIDIINDENEEDAKAKQLFGEHTEKIETALQKNDLYLDNRTEILEDPVNAIKRIFFSIQRGTIQSTLILLTADNSEKAITKLNKAKTNFANYADDTPILLFDDSITGSVKSGFLLTNRGVYVKNLMDKPWFSSFDEVSGIRTVGGISLLDDSILGRKTIDTTQISGKDEYDFYDFVELLFVFLKYGVGVGGSLSAAPTMKAEVTTNNDDVISVIRESILKADKVRLSLFAIDESEKADKKFQNALSTYAKLEPGERPVVIYDSTVFGSGKNGCLISDRTIYINNSWEKPTKIDIADIITVGINGNGLSINQHKVALDGVVGDNNRRAFESYVQDIIAKLK